MWIVVQKYYPKVDRRFAVIALASPDNNNLVRGVEHVIRRDEKTKRRNATVRSVFQKKPFKVLGHRQIKNIFNKHTYSR